MKFSPFTILAAATLLFDAESRVNAECCKGTRLNRPRLVLGSVPGPGTSFKFTLDKFKTNIDTPTQLKGTSMLFVMIERWEHLVALMVAVIFSAAIVMEAVVDPGTETYATFWLF